MVHLIFLDRGWPWVNETAESESMDKVGMTGIAPWLPVILITGLTGHHFLWLCDVYSLLPGPCAMGRAEGEPFFISQKAGFHLVTLGTTATETLAVAGNIFVGMVSTLRPPDLPFSCRHDAL